MYLTKSRFKTGMSCPTKLYYESSEKYENNDDGNEFMKALAKGGLQVGEMAKLYYPGGVEIDGRNKEDQLTQTNNALQQENIIIYEAAIKVDHKFIRVDILEKKGNLINIIEVKSTSCNGSDESQFTSTKTLKKREYLEDIAFQYLVCLDYFKEYNVIPYLMMVDKNIECSVDGLYSQFVIRKEGKRDKCKTLEGITKDELGIQIMTAVKVKNTLEYLINDDYYREHPDFGGRGFKAVISWFEDLLLGYENAELAYLSEPHKKCKECQFHSDDNARSGFYNCLKTKMNWSDSDFDKPLLYDVWDYSDSKKRIDEGKWFMQEISELDIEIKDPKSNNILQFVCDKTTFFLDVVNIIDLKNEEKRIIEEMEKIKIEIDKINKMLRNSKFIKNAPDEVVKKQKENFMNYKNTLTKLEEAKKNIPTT